jgi:4'-phosphopantetheinyl transferase
MIINNFTKVTAMIIIFGNVKDVDEAAVNRWKSMVDGSRVAKVQSKHFENDRNLSILGDLLSIKISAEILNKKEIEIKLKYETGGKPYIDGENIFISVSHSKDIVICAVDFKPLGIDLEYVRNFKPLTMQKICNEHEIEYIGSDNQKFFEIWTVKEAYSKLCGIGIRQIISGIFVDIENSTVEGKHFNTVTFGNYVYSIVSDSERTGGIEKD